MAEAMAEVDALRVIRWWAQTNSGVTHHPADPPPTLVTIIHEGGNTITGTLEDVLNHGHLKPGWKYVPEPTVPVSGEAAQAVTEVTE